jgi:membrane-associated phospholipid phosphatase
MDNSHLAGAVVCSLLTILLSGFIAYSLKHHKTTGRIPWVNPWVYRKDDPVLYWFEIGLYVLLTIGLFVASISEMQQLFGIGD